MAVVVVVVVELREEGEEEERRGSKPGFLKSRDQYRAIHLKFERFSFFVSCQIALFAVSIPGFLFGRAVCC